MARTYVTHPWFLPILFPWTARTPPRKPFLRPSGNALENFWSLLKRGIKGTYVSVEPFHLFHYLDEQTFRFNHRRKRELQSLVNENVEVGSKLYTDALKSYEGLGDDFVHQAIDHAESYVNGQVHTNGCENFWSLLKRGINGTYVSVEPFHLFRYVDEQAFRFNERTQTDSERFEQVCKQIVGRRLTWDRLTGKEGTDAIQ